METKTETGYVLSALNYKDSEVQRFDDLAFHLYCGRTDELREKLAVLLWQFNEDNHLFGQEYLEKKFKEFNEIMINRT